jgi:L-amino acid N-acyltransferase YncA
VELSYFVHSGYLKKGIGTQLLQHAINAAHLLHYHTALAIIIDKNVPSAQLLQKFGFEQWGFLPDVAEFDGVICSHVYYGKSLLPQ